MAIVVLGGAGSMGRAVVRALVEAGHTDIIIADLALEAAREVASTVSPSPTVAAVDVSDAAALRQAISHAHVVVNCVGPFYRFAPEICRAAVEQGKRYVDICDDHEPTAKMLELDSLARERGATAIVGCGWTPGVTNVLARLGVNAIPDADTVRITWVGSEIDLPPGGGSGIAIEEHVLHTLSEPATVYRSSRYETVRPLDEPLADVDAGEPFGAVKAYCCGHPEPITLPRFLPQLKHVSVRGAILPRAIDEVYALLVRLGATSSRETMGDAARVMADLATDLATRGIGGVPRLSGAVVEVEASGSGRRARYIASDRMDRLTGIPCAVGAGLLAIGAVPTPGVLGPEAAFEPRDFVTRLAAAGISIKEEHA